MKYAENPDSQLPALHFLQKLNWQHISREQAEQERGGMLSNVLLERILETQLKKINSFEYKGTTYPFSEGNIQAAIHSLKNIPDEGLVRTAEKVFDLITLGRSFEETIQGDKKSFTIKFIDWENPQNNVYHVTEEFVVEGLKETRRPDLVLFVNGIPFVVIENKRRDKNRSLEESISQFIRNQKKEDGIPRLFHYAHVLLAVQPNEVKYGTTGTPMNFWGYWQEEGEVKNAVMEVLQRALPGIPAESRMPTEQDKNLYNLCRIDRLMELVYKFIVFDTPDKKLARYQQFFAVKHSLDRVKQMDAEGSRKGGVIWHTQGSGKSLTMVMLAKCIALDKSIPNARVIIVTDRIDLDKQIWNTFRNCGKTAERAKSGNNLVELISESGVEVITTVIDKFDAALNRKDFKNSSPNIFVLVDESHRSQYGLTHAKMKRVLPNACYIGFTGTPLLKRDKSTADKFGGFIDKYTINQAVRDGAVVPLLYEGRSAKLSINEAQLNRGFDRVSEPLNEMQRRDLKRKHSSITEVYKSQMIIDEIAYDISEHYTKYWKGTGFKAMLAVPLKATAMKYQAYFEKQNNPRLKIHSAVIISNPDTRENHEDVDEEPNDDVQKWLTRIKKDYNTLEEYEEKVISQFKNSEEEVELLIVVGKLLTGFDAPRCNTLYIAKPLAEHNLLQAIARANRLFKGKDYGYIIDYVGILGQLDHALTQYSALSEFDESDLIGTVLDIAEELDKIPQYHSALWDVFKDVENKKDIEALERFLAPKDIRDKFRECLINFAKTLQAGMSSDEFYNRFTEIRINKFIGDLKFFQSLRSSVQLRYAEKIDYKEYESRIRKLLDMHVTTEGVEQVVQAINIFDEKLFKEEVERITGTTASKADAIAYKMKKVATEKMDEDPVFYKKFGELIDEAIRKFQEKRSTEAEYLEEMMNARKNLVEGRSDDTPVVLNGNPEARAVYGILKQTLLDGKSDNGSNDQADKLAAIGIELTGIIERLLIRDWKRNEDVQKQMKNDLEDYLLARRSDLGLDITFSQLDVILEEVLKVARSVY